MKAIRGATTLTCDCEEDVRIRVGELLTEIKEINRLNYDDIICIMFSTTADIRSFYPAKAAREAGFATCSLYSSLEPDIEGALNLCVRVMLLVEMEGAPRHVYLHGARILRKDLSGVLNIAIDGPAGSGKSTVSELIAQRLDILHLDTGAMYRAVGLKCLKSGTDYADGDAVKHMTEKLDLRVEYRDGKQLTMLDGTDVSGEIRTAQVSMLASYVSAYSFVRNKMLDLQRKIARTVSCVIDGRDIGTNVLPDCQFKFFVTASPEVRARRRYDEDRAKGATQSYDEILKEMNERDRQDQNRAVAPLRCATDAVTVDTSSMTIDGVVNLIIAKIQERI